jgi:hypothetical protein
VNVTYPQVPYPGYTWPLTQHMGVINESNLYPILWAADNFSTHNDPALVINEYLVANNIFTVNVRNDSGQPDAWRDYQQILSELGLIYSTEISKKITLTPLGIAYLDKLITFPDLMILQTFRYQYPNGHKIVISSSQRKELEGSVFASSKNLVDVQKSANIMIRPATIIWRVLRKLELHSQAYLAFEEIQKYVMRCTNHEDVNECVGYILKSRNGEINLDAISGSRGKRNMQDWIKFLLKTPLFILENKTIRLSYHGQVIASNMDLMCNILEKNNTFWIPDQLDKGDRESWYSFFGSLDLSLEPSTQQQDSLIIASEFSNYDIDETFINPEARSINLQAFNPDSLRGLRLGTRETSIDVSYDAEIADRQHRLHDRMVVQIGSFFQGLGALVFFDPKTVDVFVKLEDMDLLIEVKSVTTKNILSRIRSALGQIIYYDYLRSKDSQGSRRKIIALTAKIPDDAWYIDFLNNYLDIDLISLEGQELKFFSSSQKLKLIINR